MGNKKDILSKNFYEMNTVLLARELLGKLLVHETAAGTTVGRIVETEAYVQGDPACHASRGMTPRNKVMFGLPGHAYVYFIYGMYYCFNVVSAPLGVGEAVLLRALEPLEGIDLMRNRRQREKKTELCSGPAKLVLAMGITKEHNGVDITKGNLVIYQGPKPSESIAATGRIGISTGTELPLRFYLKDNKYISKK